MARTSKASVVRRFAQGFGLELSVSQEKKAVTFVHFDEAEEAPVIDHPGLVAYLESLGGINPMVQEEAPLAEEALVELVTEEDKGFDVIDPAFKQGSDDEETLPLVAYYNMPSFGNANSKITLVSTVTGEAIESRRRVHKSVAGCFVVYMATWAPGERHSLEDLELDAQPQLLAQIVRRIRSWFGKSAVSLTKGGIQVNLRLPE